jgi:hypothetical protein
VEATCLEFMQMDKNRSGFTVKLMTLKLQDPTLAWVPSKALGGAISNYSQINN